MQPNSPLALDRERRATGKNPPLTSSRSTRRASARRQESEAPGHGHTPVQNSPAPSKTTHKPASRTAKIASGYDRTTKPTSKKKTPSPVAKDAEIKTDLRGPRSTDTEEVTSSPVGPASSASKARKTITPQSVQDKIKKLTKRCESGSDPGRRNGSSSPLMKQSKKIETGRCNSARPLRIQTPRTFTGADNNSSRPQSPIVSMPAPSMGARVMTPQPVARLHITPMADGPLESFRAEYSGHPQRMVVARGYAGILNETSTATPVRSSRATSLAPSHGPSHEAPRGPSSLTTTTQPLKASAVLAKKAWERSLPPPPVLQRVQGSALMAKRNGTPTTTPAAVLARPQLSISSEAARASVTLQDAGFNENMRPGFSSNRLSSPRESSIISKRRSFISTAEGNIQNGTPGTPAAGISETEPPRKHLKRQRSPLAKQATSRRTLAIANAVPIIISLDVGMNDAPRKSELTQPKAKQTAARSQTQPTNRPTPGRFENQAAVPSLSNTVRAQYGNQSENHVKPRKIADTSPAPTPERQKGCKSCFNLKTSASVYPDLSVHQRSLRCNNCQQDVVTEARGHYEGSGLQPGQSLPEPGSLPWKPSRLFNRSLVLNTEERHQGGYWWEEGSYYDVEMDEDMLEWSGKSGVLETAEEDNANIQLGANIQEPEWSFYEDMEFGAIEGQFLSGS